MYLQTKNFIFSLFSHNKIEKSLFNSKFFVKIAISFLSGTLYSLALPPCNLEVLAFVSLVPLLFIIVNETTKKAAILGWIWGIGWAVFSFQFLREINPIIPYLLAPILGLWPAIFAFCIPFLYKNIVKKDSFDIKFLNFTIFALTSASLFVLLEWTRSRLFVWNDFSITQWQNLNLIQMAKFTGSYGINFIVALGNLAVFSLIYRKKVKIFFIIFAVIYLGLFCLGDALLKCRNHVTKNQVYRFLAIQGDLSQRRHATTNQAVEALEKYKNLTTQAIAENQGYFDTIIWPESAIPLLYLSDLDLSKAPRLTEYGKLCLEYQNIVKEIPKKAQANLLFGAIDTIKITLPDNTQVTGTTNSAFLLDKNSTQKERYDKTHRVPFGEYIPFRHLLPQFIINYIDMGRDLVPGTRFTPFDLGKNIKGGILICYEGVFGYLTRKIANNGANVLIALSNDAWYPVSSEPEQHLANVLIRCIETNLSMVRCGNNGGTLVITPNGQITNVLETSGNELPYLRRGSGYQVLTLNIPINPEKTFYLKYGEYFIIILAILALIGTLFAVKNYLKKDSKTNL